MRKCRASRAKCGVPRQARFRPGFFTFVRYCDAVRVSAGRADGAAANGDNKLRGQSTRDAVWRSAGAVVAILMAAAVAGCGSISERTAAAAFTSPGKYDIYTCGDIERTALGLRTRQLELEQLMARASLGAGGEFASIIAYRGEYAQGRGELVELGRAKANKQCASESQYSSGRAVF